MSFADSLKKFFKFSKKKSEVITEIDPETIRENEKIQHLQKAYAYEKSKRIKAEQLLNELTSQQEDNRENVAKELSMQKEEILARELGIASSLKKILNARGKKSIHVVSYNRERDFGILRDIGFSANGLLSVYVHNVKRPIISGRTPHEIFRNCAGLRTDANKGIVSINLNSDGEYVENLEQIEVPEVIIDFNKKINILHNDTKPFIERIIEKNNYIDELFHEIKVNERMISELTKEINMEKKNNEVLETENESYKSDLSDALNRMTEIQKNYNKLTQSLSVLEDDNLLYEKFKEKMEKVIDELHDKLSEKREQTTVDEAMADLKNIVDWYESNRPQVQIVETSSKGEEEPKKQLPKPVKG